MVSPKIPLVLITNAVPSAVLAPLEGLARVVTGPANGILMSRAEVLQLAPELDAIINQTELRVDQELLERAPNLKIVANVAIGADNLDLKLMASHGVFATNVPHAFVDATADFTFGMILAIARGLVAADHYVRAGAWSSFQPGLWDGVLLRDKTLGIVGYGAIGRAVGQRATAFGMRVLHHRRTPSELPEYSSLDRLLRESDFVSLHTPLNADSHHLIDAKRLGQMKPGAYLINAARGRVVDEEALVAALHSGLLAGAALDVFENEPQVHPDLKTMSNVILTPHIGGGTLQSRHDARLFCVENVARVLSGQRPQALLNEPLPKLNSPT